MEDNGMSCVVADDHPALRRGLAAFLAAQPGITVLGEVASGEAAIAMVQRRQPDVLVLDAHMGRVGGLDVARALVAAGAPTRIVLYSGDEDVVLVEEALEAGATGFVLKGGPMSDLVRAMQTVARGQVYIDGGLAAGLIGRRRTREGSKLSDREREIVERLAMGQTTGEMAAQLFLSPSTVRSYAESAMHKMQARNRVQLVANSVRLGLVG